jgi:hypothetical protein
VTDALPITYPKTGGQPVEHTDKNWRDGLIAYDHSGDAHADPDNEKAQERIRTKQTLATLALARGSNAFSAV